MYILQNATDFNNACKAVDRAISTKCEIYVGGTLTATMVGDGINGEIISMEWDNTVCSNDGLQIGTCCMDEFKMSYHPTTTTLSLMGKEIHPYVGVDISGTVTYVPLGVFWVTDATTDDDGYTVSITAYDGMQNLVGDFNANALNVTFPIHAWDLLTAIATHFSLTVDYDDWVYALLSSDDYYLYTSGGDRLVVQSEINSNKFSSMDKPYEGTYRDYIGWIAGLVGANAHMGRDGHLVIARYTDHGFSIGRDVQHLGGAKINYGGSVTYTSVISGTEENPIYPIGYSGNAITYSNPYMTETELTNVCVGLFADGDITVTPCDVTWRSNPCVDAGDIVSVVDKDGNDQAVYVMERVMRITGGMVEELHCYGETEVAKALNRSPMVTKFAQLSQNMKDFADLINGTDGVFRFIDNGDGTNGGFTIYENGNQAFLRCTAGGIGLSQDGGLTYTNAITKNGVVASQLDVEEDGVSILKAYKTSSAGATYNHPRLEMYNNEGEILFRIYAWNSTWGAMEDGVSMRMFAQESRSTIFEVNTSADSNTGKMSSTFLTVDPPNRDTTDGKNYGIQISTRDDDYARIRIFKEKVPLTDVFSITASWEENEQKDNVYIEINGRTYHPYLTTIDGMQSYILRSIV